jgi:hypothetical protein
MAVYCRPTLISCLCAIVNLNSVANDMEADLPYLRLSFITTRPYLWWKGTGNFFPPLQALFDQIWTQHPGSIYKYLVFVMGTWLIFLSLQLRNSSLQLTFQKPIILIAIFSYIIICTGISVLFLFFLCCINWLKGTRTNPGKTNPGQTNTGQTNPGHDKTRTRQTPDTTNPGHNRLG